MTHRNKVLIATLVIGAGAIAAYAVAHRTPSADTAPLCRLNAFGIGGCTFSNNEALPWSLCGQVVVRKGSQVIASKDICSGVVRTRSSVTEPFALDGVHEACPSVEVASSGEAPSDACVFAFEAAR